jgi:Carboxypeptidase regulatory-like domain
MSTRCSARSHSGRLLAGLLLASVASAGGARLAAAPSPADRPSQQQPPARDTSALRRVAGTAAVYGRVITADTGRPVKRARVFVSASELPDGRAAATDRDGRYAVEGLPAGRYTISVSKAGFVSMAYGQRSPLRTGKPLSIRDGEQVRGVDFRLPRGSVISGRVFDEDGEPLLGASVRVLRFTYSAVGRRLVPAGSGSSDDRGYFRVYGLMPGTYYVAATSRLNQDGPSRSPGAPPDPNAPPVGYAPTYYPGVTSVSEASSVFVGLQQEIPDIDFTLQLVQTARVSGFVVGPDGSTVGGSITLATDDERGLAGEVRGTRVLRDGSFVISDVPPGRYVVTARAQDSRSESPLFAAQTVAIVGQDVTGVALTLTRGGQVTGAVTFETMSGTERELPRLTIRAVPLNPSTLRGSGSTRIQQDGSFTISNVPAGPYLIRVAGLSSPWTLKGVYVSGRDVSDVPLEVRNNQSTTGVSIVLTDRPTEITGTVVDSQNLAAPDAWVIAFAVDPGTWRPQTRQVQASRADSSGVFHFRGLPPGDYHLVALDDVEQGAWYDPSFLEKVRSSAVRVSVNEGEVRSQPLKLASSER